MKAAFYLSWLVYISLMLINICGVHAPLWVVPWFKLSVFLTFSVPAALALFKVLDKERHPTVIETPYFEAIFISFILRSLLFCVSIFNDELYELSNRPEMVMSIGTVMIIYYIFDVRRKIKAIERTLL